MIRAIKGTHDIPPDEIAATMIDPEGRGLKSRMKKADKLGARFVVLLGYLKEKIHG